MLSASVWLLFLPIALVAARPGNCRAGTFPYNSSYCQQCPAGSSSNGSSACSPCLPGTFASVAGSASCASCSLGSFASGVGSTNCSVCPAGYTTLSQGSNSSNACTPCAQGAYLSAQPEHAGGGSTCIECPSGTWSAVTAATNSSVCQACPAGTASNVTGANSLAKCAPCATGYYAPAGSIRCHPCAAGTFSNATGSTNCTLCPVGSSSAAASSVCNACGAGTFAPTAGSLCEYCPAGTYSAASTFAGPCAACSPGYYSGLGSVTCTSCPPGTYSSASGTPVCRPCPQGTFSNSSASLSCAHCPAGYISSADSTSCVACAPGTSWNAQFDVCEPCLPGTFSSGAASLECSDCPQGTFAEEAGSSMCTACDISSYANVTGATSNATCGRRYFFAVPRIHIVSVVSPEQDTNFLMMWVKVNYAHVPGSPMTVYLGNCGRDTTVNPDVTILYFTVPGPDDVVEFGFTIVNYGGQVCMPPSNASACIYPTVGEKIPEIPNSVFSNLQQTIDSTLTIASTVTDGNLLGQFFTQAIASELPIIGTVIDMMSLFEAVSEFFESLEDLCDGVLASDDYVGSRQQIDDRLIDDDSSLGFIGVPFSGNDDSCSAFDIVCCNPWLYEVTYVYGRAD